jgi:molecular chaperone DnaJ
MCDGKGWALHLYTSADGSYQHMENTTCKVCQGTGIVHAPKCRVCAGTGIISVEKEHVVEFDPAATNPPTLVIQRAGHQSADGYHQGDLRIQFVFEDHPNFTVDETAVYHTHQVSLLAIVEGFEHTIKLPTGESVRIRHRGGRTRGFQRVIPGKGVVNKHYERGDLVVRVEPSFDIPLTSDESARLLKVNSSRHIDLDHALIHWSL